MAKIGETITLQGGIKTGYAPGTEQWDVGSGQQVQVKNSRTVNGQLYYDIQHIGGGTGWTLASNLDAAMQAQPVAPAPAPISSTAQAGQLASPVAPATVENQQANVLASMGNQVNQATQSLANALAEQQKQNQVAMDAEKAKQTGALDEIKNLTTPFRQDEETAGRAKYGTEQVLVEQKALLGELGQLLTEGNELIRQQKEVTGLSAIRNPRIQKTMDDVMARAGVIEAVVNLQNTYLSNAYHAIDRTVSAITGDRQDRINYYASVLELATNGVIELTAEKRNLANQQMDILKANLNQGLTTANYIKELMTNPSTALVMAKSGVTLNDSVEQINAKMADYQTVKEIQDMTNEFTSAGAQPVVDPSRIPAHRLRSFTDSFGKVHYFEMPEAPKGSGGYTVDNDLGTIFGEDDDYADDYDTDVEPVSIEATPPAYTPSRIGKIYVDDQKNAWQFRGKEGWVKTQ